jgi:protein-tyrosine phosphatase
MKKILLTGTGNWFRSRFAEAYLRSKGVFCESRGLNLNSVPDYVITHWSYRNNNCYSQWTGERLSTMNLLKYASTERKPLTEEDLKDPDNHVVAMDFDEHYPMIKEKFPRHLDKVTYFQIPDYNPENMGTMLKLDVTLSPQLVLNITQSNIDTFYYDLLVTKARKRSLSNDSIDEKANKYLGKVTGTFEDIKRALEHLDRDPRDVNELASLVLDLRRKRLSEDLEQSQDSTW